MASDGARVPIITPLARKEQCTAITEWSADSYVLQVRFEYGERESAPCDIQQNRLHQFADVAQPARVVLGDVELAYYDRERTSLLEFYTNPTLWRRTRLGCGTSASEPAWLHFDPAVFDSNGIASFDVTNEIDWDPRLPSLLLRFKSELRLCRWYSLADTVAFGIDEYVIVCAASS